MAINLDLLARTYFWLDKPVPYKLADDKQVLISPVTVENSEMFLSWIDVISIDKNSLPDPKYISMSYLDFMVSALFQSESKEIAEQSAVKLASILKLCLGWDGSIGIGFTERGKARLQHEDILLTGKQFEDIRRIILYQNLFEYDDAYVNPDVKKAMDDVDSLRNKDIDIPTLERKMAIITAHTGLSKAEQAAMTYRSHCVLFREVYGEVDYSTVRTAVMVGNMFSKKKIELEDWIYRKKHNKYEKYFTTQESYNQSMGGSGKIHSDAKPNVDLSLFNN